MKQEEYVSDFLAEVIRFLDFHSRYQSLAKCLAEKITAHATPVGSGTVARTKQIPIEKRAEAAVIAWMRHQTTRYETMSIARIKGRRREIRRQLALQSIELLRNYRQGCEADQNCPLLKAMV